MQCPSCGFDNPEGMKFCGECVTPLKNLRPQCGFENPPRFKFGGNCATPLSQQTPASSPIQPDTQPAKEPKREPLSYTPQHLAEEILTSRRALQGERKQVTVLFADIKDSTELIKDLDWQ
jgi:hypothetical protein